MGGIPVETLTEDRSRPAEAVRPADGTGQRVSLRRLFWIFFIASFLGANISWQGHLGGLVVGGIVSAIYAWAPRGKRQVVGIAGTVAVAVALVGLDLLRVLLS